MCSTMTDHGQASLNLCWPKLTDSAVRSENSELDLANGKEVFIHEQQ